MKTEAAVAREVAQRMRSFNKVNARARLGRGVPKGLRSRKARSASTSTCVSALKTLVSYQIPERRKTRARRKVANSKVLPHF